MYGATYNKPPQYTELGVDCIADFSKTMVHSYFVQDDCIAEVAQW